MYRRAGIILDLTFFKDDMTLSLERKQRLLEICSLIIFLFDTENPGTQFIILKLNHQNIGQITHLTGNIKHHYQGIWHSIFFRGKGDNLDLGLFFSERINCLKREITKYEIFFISEGNLDFLNSNFFAVFIGKENRNFSVISLCSKSFGLQILIKITGGHYVTLIGKKKEMISHVILNKIQKFCLAQVTFTHIFSFIFKRLIFQKFNFGPMKKTISPRISKICFNCKSNLKSKLLHHCINCGAFLFPERGLDQFWTNLNKFKIFGQKFKFVFNLFTAIVFEKKSNSERLPETFNFFSIYGEKKTRSLRISSYYCPKKSYDEILFAD